MEKDKLRSFIAINIPLQVKNDIADFQAQIKKSLLDIRLVAPHNIHLTLTFLGDISLALVPKIEVAIKRSVHGLAAPELIANGMGVFPHFKHPRVLWIGLDDPTNHIHLVQQQLAHNLEELGFKKEDKRFKSHLTVGRIKNKINPRHLINTIEKFAEYESEPFIVDEIVLFKSQLTPNGAIYSRIAQIPWGSQNKYPDGGESI